MTDIVSRFHGMIAPAPRRAAAAEAAGELERARAENARLRAEALRFYNPDGTFEVLDSPGDVVARRKGLAWRVGELEAENARLKAGLEMVARIVHGSTRTTHRIAGAVLGGADPRDPRFVEDFP